MTGILHWLRLSSNIVVVAAAIFGGLTNASRAQEPTSGRKYALLVGVHNYDKNELRNLPFTEQDIEALAKVFENAGFRRVVVLTQTRGAKESRFLPLAANIRTSLRGMLEDRQPEDSVIVALAGHGVQFRGDEHSYFCPMDAKLGDRESLIPLDEIFGGLKTCDAGLKLLLVDACRNDPQSDHSRARSQVNLESVTRPQSQKPPGGVAAFFSCSEGERAFESPELKHGVFFHYVIEAMGGKADFNKDNSVSVDEVVLYAKSEVPDRVKDEFGDDVRQMPELVGSTRGLAPLVTLARVERSSPPRPKEPAPMPASQPKNSPPAKLSRAEIVAHYREAIDVRGESAKGVLLFKVHCFDCHGAYITGSVGPKLTSNHVRDPEKFLINLFDPNREVAPKYVQYVLKLTNGDQREGLLLEQTQEFIELLFPAGVKSAWGRDTVEEFRSTGKSLMPENFESVLSIKEVADLMAYLKSQ